MLSYKQDPFSAGIIVPGQFNASSDQNESKQQLLAALREVFVQRGYDGATLAHLAQAAGLSKATLYHHFPGGKNEMVQTLIRYAIADLQQQAFSHLYASQPPKQRIVNLIFGFASYTQQGRSDCLLAILTHHQAAQDEVAHHHMTINKQFTDWHGLLQVTLQEAGLKKKPARRAAHGLIAGLYGALVNAKLHNDPTLFGLTLKGLAKPYKS